MTKDKWVWMPHPAHFICARWCRFFLATYVGKYIVSTVGEYVPDSEVREIYNQTRNLNLEGMGDAREADFLKKNGFEDLHYGGWKYETMVFEAVRRKESGDGYDCCPWEINVMKEKETELYKTATDAYKGHMKLCNKWSKKL